VIGAALSIGGLLYQGLFRNPMAEPYVIGSSGGAALGAAVSLIVPRLDLLGFSATASMAFLFSMATVLTVYAIARVNGRVAVVSLLLAGLAFSAMLEFATWFLTSLDRDGARAARLLGLWLHGAVSTPTYSQLLGSLALLAICLAAAVPMTGQLNTLALGDEQAQSLGIPLEWTRGGIIILGSLLTALAVSLGGIIGFVGLIVPHFLRMLFGPDHRTLLPLCALGGAIFLLAADTLARTVLAPAEMPVGVLTAFIGGPAFLYLLRRSRREWMA
jgi:iron complex transport system permease protein